MCKKVFRFQAFLVFVFLLICLFARSQSPVETHLLRTVVIDPGHGGHDPGAISGGIREKDLVLTVALRLGNKIKTTYPDVKIIYTRAKDEFVPLYERAARAIKNKADLFISIHANYVAETGVRGTETFTLGLHRSQENLEVAKKENSVILLEDNYTANYEGFDPKETESYIMFENMQSEYQSQSIALAANIQDAFTRNIGLHNRGVKQAGFLVLRKTSMPSVLIEIGFISNPAERKFLTSETGKEKISESIFQAFSTYKKSIDQKSRFELAVSEQPGLTDQDTNRRKVTGTPGAVPLPEAAGDNNKSTSGSVRQSTTDSLSRQQILAGTPKEKKEKSTSEKPPLTPPETKNNSGVNPGSMPDMGNPGNMEVIYSVQIGAVKIPIDPVPGNFRGEKSVFRLKVEPYYKFYSGRFADPKEAFAEKARLSSKFPDAFVVVIEKNIPRIFVK